LRIHAGVGNRVGVTPIAIGTPAVKANSSVTYTSTYVGRSSWSSYAGLSARVYNLNVFTRVLTTDEIIRPTVTFVNAPYYAGLLGTTKIDINYAPSSASYTFAAWLYRISGGIFMRVRVP
jgi:hypothetical protein